MKKKNIIIAAVCLFVLVLPVTIYAVGCTNHTVQEKHMEWESRGWCLWELVDYKYCPNCDYKEYTASGNIFERHSPAVRLPDTYVYSDKTATQHTRKTLVRVQCANYAFCKHTDEYLQNPVKESHRCARHVSVGINTLHICSCGKEKYGTSSNHW